MHLIAAPGTTGKLGCRALVCASFMTAAFGFTAPPGSTIAVTGTTGKLGRLVVQQLIGEGYKARCLLRHPKGRENIEPSCAPTASKEAVVAWLASLPGVEFVPGDVTDPGSCAELLRGCSACLALHGARRTTRLSDLLPWSDPTVEPTHSKQVNFEGVRNLIDAAKRSGSVCRIVRITGKGETPWSPFSILINGLGSMAKAYNYEGEQLLRAAAGAGEIEYTIIRPGVMGKGDEELGEDRDLVLADNGAGLKVSSIPHRCVAQLCVASLGCANTARATLTAMTVPRGEGARSFAPLLARVASDSRAFAPSLLREHQLAVRVGGSVIAAAFVAILAGLGRAALGILSIFRAAV